MSRTFTDTTTLADDDIYDNVDDADNTSEELSNDNETSEPSVDNDELTAGDDTDDDDTVDLDALFQSVYDNMVNRVDNDPVAFAAEWVAGGGKRDTFNEVSNARTLDVARDNNIDPADKGMLMTELALFSEAVLATIPASKGHGKTAVNPADVARDKAMRLLAIREHLDIAWATVDNELRENAVVAGITTTEDLDALDKDNEIFTPNLDTSNVTFTKKFAESLEYVTTTTSRAKSGGGKSSGEDFTPGQTRYDSHGNACRYDGTHYFFTPKGGTEQDKKYTSSSTLAKKEVANGSERNGKVHFKHHTDPTSS